VKRLWGVVAVVALAAPALATAAADGVFGGANVRATFKGWVTPRALPRDRLEPIALHLSGHLRTVDGELPPPVRSITIAINRQGKVSTAGLPTCRRGEITARRTAGALRRCEDALIGRGTFEAHIRIPTSAPFPAFGRVLAFNGIEDGRRVIHAHIFGTDPLPTSEVLTLRFQRPASGTFGTELTMTLPEIGDEWGHVTGFRLDLERRYRYRGRERSLLSARCPAPEGRESVAFSAAKGTFHLTDGRELSRIVVGRCSVRK
jgi:hypothetical protein